jgi:hypothetical protein
MSVIDIPCDDWPDVKGRALQRIFGSSPFVRGKYFFRGQSSDKYGLESSFDRWYRVAGLAISKPQAEKRLIDLFKEEMANHLAARPNPETEAETIALAQHYGVPTRLLDWTESPYIAAFFAFANLTSASDPDARVAIWCLDASNSLWSEDKGIQGF